MRGPQFDKLCGLRQIDVLDQHVVVRWLQCLLCVWWPQNEIQVQILPILPKVSVVLLCPSRQIPGQYLKSVHNSFIPQPSLFTNS